MRSALIVWGGWSGHDPEECAAIYRRWLHEDGFSVRVENNPEVFLEPEIKDLSLIVPCTTMDKISREAANNLAAAIEGGVGMGGHHGTMGDSFHDSPVYQFITGGQWVAHPGNIIDYTVEVTRPEDPVMKGIPASFPYTTLFRSMPSTIRRSISSSQAGSGCRTRAASVTIQWTW